MWACQNMGKYKNFGARLVEIQKVTHLTKCYSKIAKVWVKKIGMPTFWYTSILVANQADP